MVIMQEEVNRVLTQANKGGAVIHPAHDTFWGGYSGHFKELGGRLLEVSSNQQRDLKE
ncbi:hypothetical protein [Peribacillus muralis]|uniref:hypothetical protein n=1 Tax=Peribacillus muralis TaxID=264697 RepID=UPI003D003ABE